MTVFVVNPVQDDLSAAHKFGELRYINRSYVHGDELEYTYHRHKLYSVLDFDPTTTPQIVDYDIGRDWTIPTVHRMNMTVAAAEFDLMKDCLLIAGDHLQLLAMSALLAARLPSFMVLRYDRKNQDYIPVRLYSGLAPTPGPVLGSGHIGETTDGQERNQDETRTGVRLGIEAPLERRDPRRP